MRKAEAKVRVLTKSGADFSRRFPLIVTAVASIRAKSVTLDGEAVCFTAGEQDFDKLWNGGSDAILCAFDLLELNGIDLRDQPLLKRKARLQKLIKGNIEFVHHIQGDGQAIFDHACRMGLEGIVSKRIDAPYKPGPSKSWLKTKNAAIRRLRACAKPTRRSTSADRRNPRTAGRPRNAVALRALAGMIWFSLAKLAIEGNGVIASRLALMATGSITASEAQLMVTEKMFAAVEAGAILATGGNVDKVVSRYRHHCKANARRLRHG